MTYKSTKSGLEDVAFTLATPFSEDGERVLHDELAEHVRWLKDAGASLFLPCGNTGEYYSLTQEERVAVVETVVEAADEDDTVIGGAGGSTKTAMELIDAYDRVGVDGVMVMSLSHTYIHQDGAVDYYRRLTESTDLPLILYKRGPSLSDDALIELSTVENVVGVKYAVNDIAGFSRVVSESEGDVTWVNGIAERFAPAFDVEGAVGFTTGIGNALPAETLALFDALEAGEMDRAKEIRDALRPLEDLRAEAGPDNIPDAANNVPAVKHAMDLVGLYGGPIREPLVGLSEADAARVEEYVESAQATIDAD
jgi:4-hydroxy-tetrahydrodipicolinate synthase